MDTYTLILLISIIAGFLMAFSLGANDVSNAMATSVASKAITIRQAVIIAACLNFIGAVFLGSNVTGTIAKGIVDPESFADNTLFMIGMLSALLSAGLWVLIASITSFPVSSTHSIIGGIIGFAIVSKGFDIIHWDVLCFVFLAWIIAPFFGGIVAFTVFSLIRKFILYRRRLMYYALFWSPIWLGLTVSIILLSFFFKTPYGQSLNLTWHFGFGLFVSIMLLSVLCGYFLRSKIKLNNGEKPAKRVENIFKKMQLSTASFVALSQGANDVANAIGPVAAIVFIIRDQQGLPGGTEVPLWLLCMGGIGIAVGITCLGYRVMNTLGEGITKLNNTRGFSVDFSSATTILIASNLGMPISATHATVGAITGVGLARGLGAVDFRVLYKIFCYWLITIPVSALSCIVIFLILKWLIL